MKNSPQFFRARAALRKNEAESLGAGISVSSLQLCNYLIIISFKKNRYYFIHVNLVLLVK